MPAISRRSLDDDTEPTSLAETVSQDIPQITSDPYNEKNSEKSPHISVSLIPTTSETAVSIPQVQKAAVSTRTYFETATEYSTSSCPGSTYIIKANDNCTNIETLNGITLTQLTSLNPTLNCNALIPGQSLNLWQCEETTTAVYVAPVQTVVPVTYTPYQQAGVVLTDSSLNRGPNVAIIVGVLFGLFFGLTVVITFFRIKSAAKPK